MATRILLAGLALAGASNTTECKWNWKQMRCSPQESCTLKGVKCRPRAAASDSGSKRKNLSIDLDALNPSLANSTSTEIVEWAAEHFKDGLVLQSSFGVTAAVMLHLVVSVVPNVPVILVDTGYFPPETYKFIEDLTASLELNLKTYKGLMSPEEMEATHGKLWENHQPWAHELYGKIRKVEPMERALDELNATAVLTGLRAEQTDFRKSLSIVNAYGSRYKICPLLNWSKAQVNAYIRDNGLPFHPLKEQGYETVGDAHSSRPVSAYDENARSTRFGGVATECGLHTQIFK